MPGKTPDKEPVENGGYRGGKDLKPKGKKASKKDGDDEMTVVVPPSKANKQSSVPPPNDAEGDVAMDDAEGEVKVDPVVQTINGMRTRPRGRSLRCICSFGGVARADHETTCEQTSRATTPF